MSHISGYDKYFEKNHIYFYTIYISKNIIRKYKSIYISKL